MYHGSAHLLATTMPCHRRKGKEAVDASQIRGAMGGEKREIPALLLVVSVKLDESRVWCFCPEVKDTDCFLLLLSYSHAFAIASRVLVIKNHCTYYIHLCLRSSSPDPACV